MKKFTMAVKRKGAAKNGAKNKKIKTTTPSAVSVRKALLGLAEGKRWAVAGLTGGGNMNSATIYWANPLYYMTGGTSENQRVGDSIYIEFIEINATLRTIAGEDNLLTYMLSVLETDQEARDGVVSPGPMAGALLNDYRVQTNCGLVSNPILDTNIYTVKRYEKGEIPLKPTTTGIETQKQIKMNVQINRKFQFKTQTSGYEKFKNLYIALAVDSAAGGVAPVYMVDMSYCVHFKDF